MRIHLIHQDGKYENVIVSKDNPTYVVYPNIWFAAEVIPEEGENWSKNGSYSQKKRQTFTIFFHQKYSVLKANL